MEKRQLSTVNTNWRISDNSNQIRFEGIEETGEFLVHVDVNFLNKTLLEELFIKTSNLETIVNSLPNEGKSAFLFFDETKGLEIKFIDFENIKIYPSPPIEERKFLFDNSLLVGDKLISQGKYKDYFKSITKYILSTKMVPYSGLYEIHHHTSKNKCFLIKSREIWIEIEAVKVDWNSR